MSHDVVSRIQFELVPMLQEIISEWLIIQFFASVPSESPAVEDFSYQLSSLKIGMLFLMELLPFVFACNEAGTELESHLRVQC